jgi:multiple sugar transport system substrate-binding protein
MVSKGSYWYPIYNSSEGVKAVDFIKDQVEAGVKPQKIPVGVGEMDLEFANKKFAVMIEGSWMPGACQLN